jgi:hypothetical protein
MKIFFNKIKINRAFSSFEISVFFLFKTNRGKKKIKIKKFELQ